MSRTDAMKWVRATTYALNAQEMADRLSWTRSPRRKWWWARQTQQRREAADQLRSLMDVDPVETLARDLVHTEWRRHVGQFTEANPYHPRLDPQRRMLAPRVAAAARSRPTNATYPRSNLNFDPAEIPELWQRLTADYALAVLRERVDELSGVIADPVMLTGDSNFSRGMPALTIQHKASGLRAQFQLDADAQGFGIVFAKPYKIASVDPDNPGPCATWETYIGLGIGTRIYLEAERLNPGVRWRTRATRDGSRGVRHKLHASNPYIWQDADCAWCSEMEIPWDTATWVNFEDHPRRNEPTAPIHTSSAPEFPLEDERWCDEWHKEFRTGTTIIGTLPGGYTEMLAWNRHHIVIGDGAHAADDLIHLLAYGTNADSVGSEMALVSYGRVALPRSNNVTIVAGDDLLPHHGRAILSQLWDEITHRRALAHEHDQERLGALRDLGFAVPTRKFLVIEDATAFLATVTRGDPTGEEWIHLVQDICSNGYLYDVHLLFVVPRANMDAVDADKSLGLNNRVGLASLGTDTLALLTGATDWCTVDRMVSVYPTSWDDSPPATHGVTVRLATSARTDD